MFINSGHKKAIMQVSDIHLFQDMGHESDFRQLGIPCMLSMVINNDTASNTKNSCDFLNKLNKLLVESNCN